jgi:REP element-mobilizing transposase RayT
MARPLRIEYPGAVYHITSRGNAKQAIFLDVGDRREFLRVLSSAVERFNWLCHAYCLMDNHYHLVVETPEGNLSRGMRQLNGVYTQDFNRRHTRVGHLFQGRYGAIVVDKDSYLLSLCRYVVLNPVRSNAVNRPEDWIWSSYKATIGRTRKPSFLTVDWILSQFGGRRSEARALYKKFVLTKIEEDSPWGLVRGQILLGKDSFVKKFGKFLKEKERIEEVPRIQRYATRPSLSELFAESKRENERARNETVHLSYVRYGYTLRQIAEHLGVHYTTISRVIKRIEQHRRM